MKTKYLYLIILLSVSLTSIAHADVTPVSNPIFEKLYANFKLAFQNKDSKALANLLAPDFISEDSSGNTETAQQTIDEVSSIPDDPYKVSKTRLLAVSIHENTANITQEYQINTIKMIPNAGPTPTELITVSDDTWIKINDTWLLEKTVTKQLDYSIADKLMIHKVHK